MKTLQLTQGVKTIAADDVTPRAETAHRAFMFRRYDREDAVRLTMAKSGLTREKAETIVDVVREGQGNSGGGPLSIQSCLVIARTLSLRGEEVYRCNPDFRWRCQEIYNDTKGRVVAGIGSARRPRTLIPT